MQPSLLPPAAEVPGTPTASAETGAADGPNPIRHKFSQTVPGIALAVLAGLVLLAGKTLIGRHYLGAWIAELVALLYLGYFLWARGAKMKSRVTTGMNAVRERERRQRHSL